MPTQRPMKLDDLFALKAVGKVAIAPDGRRIAFELKRFDFEKNKNFVNIMLVDADGTRLRSLTRGERVDLLPKWSPDGTRLAFTSDRDKGRTLWVLPMEGGDPQRLTEPDGFVSDFAWSPDGSRIAYVYQEMNAREKLERDGKHDEVKKLPQYKHITSIRHKLDGAGWWNGNYTHVWIIPSDGGKPRQLTHGNYNDMEPAFSPDGRWVSFISNRVENWEMNVDNDDLFVVKAAGGATRQLTRLPGMVRGHAWSPDGKTIAYLGNPAKMGQSYKYNVHVWLLDVASRAQTELTREIDNNCLNVTIGDTTGALFEAAPLIWSVDGQRLYFLVTEEGATRLYSRSIHKRDLTLEVGGEINVYGFHRTADDGPIALAIGTATNPGDVHIYDPNTRTRATQLTRVNEEKLAKIHVAQPEPFTIKSDGHAIQGWLLKPPGFDPRRKYPAILEIHGGPHTQYGYSFFHEMQFLAAKGYVVVYSNPRGSVGYGLKFMNCIHGDWGNLDYRDVTKVADWIWKLPWIDNQRVGVTGGSYGGYMTNWVVGHTQRFKAAVTQRSVVNMESMFGTSDFGWDLGWMFGGVPWEKQAAYRRSSPLTFVKNIRTPLLIEHEEEDHRCPIEQAEQLFTSLKVLRRTVELIRFEGESHGLSRGGRPQNRAERLKRIAAWMDKYLK
ncbi:MAG: Dipeptidyl-peptidase 5 [Phycisphaerae bacterium]|nr:Dipeptidyl-peptidase 5 [Phycisphaerae bacterium]